jgi:metal-sulfur cluster biosynthetic enzyme
MDNFIKIIATDYVNEKMTKIFDKEKEIKNILKNRKNYDKVTINNALAEFDVLTSIKGVIDPELGVNIFDLGLIYDFKIENNVVYVEYTLTTMGCPMGNYIEMTILENINRNNEYDEVRLTLTFSPQWNINALPYETKLLLDML